MSFPDSPWDLNMISHTKVQQIWRYRSLSFRFSRESFRHPGVGAGRSLKDKKLLYIQTFNQYCQPIAPYITPTYLLVPHLLAPEKETESTLNSFSGPLLGSHLYSARPIPLATKFAELFYPWMVPFPYSLSWRLIPLNLSLSLFSCSLGKEEYLRRMTVYNQI